MRRTPLNGHVQQNQLHADVGKRAGEPLTEADLAREKARGCVYATRAQFAENARTWRHPRKGGR